eukprot:1787626-Pyramimonas_sp.AAC.1
MRLACCDDTILRCPQNCVKRPEAKPNPSSVRSSSMGPNCLIQFPSAALSSSSAVSASIVRSAQCRVAPSTMEKTAALPVAVIIQKTSA